MDIFFVKSPGRNITAVSMADFNPEINPLKSASSFSSDKYSLNLSRSTGLPSGTDDFFTVK